jgi:D-glycero-D-manno-heptose 1,7-bisphosphate phosphatase
MAAMSRAVFLGQDGTLIDNPPFNIDPRRITLGRGAGALRALQAHGYRLIVVANQAGVALGRYSLAALAPMEQRIQQLLAATGARLDAFYYCPHLPQSANVRYAIRCLCRKPQPGLMRRAAREWRLDLSQSWLIGDVLDDVEAGNRAGCRTVLLENGSETEWRLGLRREPQYRARSLREAVRVILTAADQGPHGPTGEKQAFDMATRR